MPFLPTSKELSAGYRWLRQHPVIAACTAAASAAYGVAELLAAQNKDAADREAADGGRPADGEEGDGEGADGSGSDGDDGRGAGAGAGAGGGGGGGWDDDDGPNPEQAQLALVLQLFPQLSNFLGQMRQADAKYAAQCVRQYLSFVRGPPNRPTSNVFGLRDSILGFLKGQANGGGHQYGF